MIDDFGIETPESPMTVRSLRDYLNSLPESPLLDRSLCVEYSEFEDVPLLTYPVPRIRDSNSVRNYYFCYLGHSRDKIDQ